MTTEYEMRLLAEMAEEIEKHGHCALPGSLRSFIKGKRASRVAGPGAIHPAGGVPGPAVVHPQSLRQRAPGDDLALFLCWECAGLGEIRAGCGNTLLTFAPAGLLLSLRPRITMHFHASKAAAPAPLRCGLGRACSHRVDCGGCCFGCVKIPGPSTAGLEAALCPPFVKG